MVAADVLAPSAQRTGLRHAAMVQSVDAERSAAADTARVFVVLKGPQPRKAIVS